MFFYFLVLSLTCKFIGFCRWHTYWIKRLPILKLQSALICSQKSTNEEVMDGHFNEVEKNWFFLHFQGNANQIQDKIWAGFLGRFVVDLKQKKSYLFCLISCTFISFKAVRLKT